jgi:hypothetical protein
MQTNEDSGHYDIIYKNNSPVTVMLHWDPQTAHVGEQYEQPPNDLYSYIFPYSTYRPEWFPPSNAPPPSDSHHNPNPHSRRFEYRGVAQPVDQDPYTTPITVPGQQIYPTQSFEPSLQQPDYYNISQQPYGDVGRPSSLPIIPDPAVAISRPPNTAAGINQSQIRISTTMYNADFPRQVAVSLDPRHIGR